MPEAYQILEFDRAYEEEVRALVRSILCDELQLQNDLSGDEDLQDIKTTYSSPGSRLMIALSRGKVVATGAIRRLSAADCELTRLYVRSDRRRQGLATAIVGDLLPFVREQGYKRILLEIRPDMDSLTPVYKRYGFVDLNEAEPTPRSGRFMAIRLAG